LVFDPILSNKLRRGCVIPAHPLALTAENKIDEKHQRALTGYYLAAGAGGLAVGVHTTQFAIHNPKVGLYQPVLELAYETARSFAEKTKKTDKSEPIMIAGIAGPTDQALKEASLAHEMGYHIGLLSLTALKGKNTDELIKHAQEVAEIIPVMGFYLQEAISGMTLSMDFWRRLTEIPNLLAIKISPFDRYQTLDVFEAVAASGRSDEIALYTGNDDTIIQDLLTQYKFKVNGREVSLRFAGGLLGQWACWTKRAVECLDRIRAIHENNEPIPLELLTLAGQLTRANQAIFDPENNFAGCIPGIAYVLQRQGLIDEIRTLDPHEKLSPGQTERIDGIIRDYPHLTDDDFVREYLSDNVSQPSRLH